MPSVIISQSVNIDLRCPASDPWSGLEFRIDSLAVFLPTRRYWSEIQLPTPRFSCVGQVCRPRETTCKRV